MMLLGAGVLAAGGMVGLGLLAAGGAEPRARWGYVAATLAFLLAAAQGAPIVALVSRLGRGLWGVPLRRAAELFGVAGLVTTPLFVVLALQLPALDHRPSIWFGWPGAPLLWDSLALALLALVGLALLHFASLPDRQRSAWPGATRHWHVLSSGIVMLGALYAVLYVFVHLVVVSDLALSLTPGWSSAVAPATQAISGFQAGLAASVLALWAIRRFAADPGKGVDPAAGGSDAAPFHAAGKLLLALALLWFYFWWSEFLTYWYGRTPAERWLLGLLMFGPSLLPFLGAFALSFALPVGLLIWNPLRNSVAGPTVAAALTLFGTLLDRVRVYVAAWTVADLEWHAAEPSPLPVLHPPGLPELLVLLGGPAAVLLLYLLALRRVPTVSRWEARAAARLKVERRFHRTRVEVVARPS